MPELVPFLKKDEIEKLTETMASQISADYNGQEPVLIGVLKGAFIFTSDLARSLSIPIQIDFIRAASYSSGTSSSGTARITQKPEISLKGKDILIVEDIIDTGLTLEHIIAYLRSFDPASIKVCTLLDKHERRVRGMTADYAGFKVERGFLVGYGLDHAEQYRHLPEIYELKL